MKQVEDFKKQAKERNITRWIIHSCSGCGYECGYLIEGENLFYDNGCYCIMYPPTPRDWQDLANAYNRNAEADDVEKRIKEYPQFAEVVKEMKQFWGFES